MVAMLAFAGNSILGRLALVAGEAGAGGFVLIRLLSGAVTLALLAALQGKALRGDWRSATALLGYAALFSYAYLALPAGTGAMILFAMVQTTMVGAGLRRGETLSPVQWAGLILSLVALGWLLSPGLEAPHPLGAAAMAGSGICWGTYSLLGRTPTDPTAATAGNFARAAALAAVLALPVFLLSPEAMPTPRGVGLAIASGALMSGLGYAIWYAALRDLSATRAGIAQLTVPMLAAAGGIVFLAEPITVRFVLASVAILAGVAVATLRRKQPAQASS